MPSDSATLGKRDPEEAPVEILDDALAGLAVVRVDALNPPADRAKKSLSCSVSVWS